MKTNIGSIDRLIRLLVGLGLLGAGLYYQNWWGLIGLLPVATALFRFCPAYTLFGVDTCGMQQKK